VPFGHSFYAQHLKSTGGRLCGWDSASDVRANRILREKARIPCFERRPASHPDRGALFRALRGRSRTIVIRRPGFTDRDFRTPGARLSHGLACSGYDDTRFQLPKEARTPVVLGDVLLGNLLSACPSRCPVGSVFHRSRRRWYRRDADRRGARPQPEVFEAMPLLRTHPRHDHEFRSRPHVTPNVKRRIPTGPERSAVEPNGCRRMVKESYTGRPRSRGSVE